MDASGARPSSADGGGRPAAPSVAAGAGETPLTNRHNLNVLMLSKDVIFHAQDNNVQAFNRGSREFIKLYNRHNVFVTCIRYFDFVLYTGGQV